MKVALSPDWRWQWVFPPFTISVDPRTSGQWGHYPKELLNKGGQGVRSPPDRP